MAFIRAGWHDTLFDRLAKELDVKPYRVRQVARGVRRSQRIYWAIVEAVQRMDETLAELAAEVAAEHHACGAGCPHCDRAKAEAVAAQPGDAAPEGMPPLSAAEREQFRRGGKYFGVFAEVAVAMGYSRKTGGAVGRGERCNPALMVAIRQAMAKIDQVAGEAAERVS